MTADSSVRAPIALARSPNVVAPAMLALPPIIESLEPQAGILILCRSYVGRPDPPNYLDSGAARRVPVLSPAFATIRVGTAALGCPSRAKLGRMDATPGGPDG